MPRKLDPYIEARKQPAICPGCGVSFVPAKGGKYHSEQCRKNHWHRTHKPVVITASRVRAEERQGEMFPAKERTCTCRDYANCMICRNEEKRRAYRLGEIPVYRLKVIAQIVATGD